MAAPIKKKKRHEREIESLPQDSIDRKDVKKEKKNRKKEKVCDAIEVENVKERNTKTKKQDDSNESKNLKERKRNDSSTGSREKWESTSEVEKTESESISKKRKKKNKENRLEISTDCLMDQKEINKDMKKVKRKHEGTGCVASVEQDIGSDNVHKKRKKDKHLKEGRDEKIKDENQDKSIKRKKKKGKIVSVLENSQGEKGRSPEDSKGLKSDKRDHRNKKLLTNDSSDNLPVGAHDNQTDLGNGDSKTDGVPKKKEKSKKKKEKGKDKKKRGEDLAQGDEGEDDSSSDTKAAGVVKSTALQYLKQWSQDRKNWKFQKVRQVWLLKNMYDKNQVPGDVFPTLLEYLNGLKGKSRETTLSEAEKVMDRDEDESSPKKGIQQEEHEERARQVIQLLS